MSELNKIAFGGGCHWCTEAVFQTLTGVELVEQGYVASTNGDSSFSEAVIVHFDALTISLQTLIEIHLHTHKSTSNHSMRNKYRSAVYVFNKDQNESTIKILKIIQNDFDDQLITQILTFSQFKASRKSLLNYYDKNPSKPFCKTYIDSKLLVLLHQYSKYIKTEKTGHLQTIKRQNEYQYL